MTDGIGNYFLKKTKYQFMDVSDQNKGVPQPPLERDYGQEMPQEFLP